MIRLSKGITLWKIVLILIALFSETILAQTNKSIHLSWTDQNTSDRSMLVTWLENFGNDGTQQAYVQYGTRPKEYTYKLASQSNISPSLQNDFHHPESQTPLDTYVHTVLLNELSPNTTYYYVVGPDNGVSQENSFRTGPPIRSRENFHFIVGSDCHSGLPESRRNELAYHILNNTSSDLPGLFLFGGDEITGNNGLVPYPDIQWARQWHRFFSLDAPSGIFKGSWAKLLANIPYMTSDSNHIDSDDSFFDLFNYPPPFGVKRLPEKPNTEDGCSYVTRHHPTKRGNSGWYSFNYGNAHFIVLQINTATWGTNPRFCTWNAPIERDQYDWLEKDLRKADADPDIQWKFAISHSAPYSFVPPPAASDTRAVARNKYLQSTICPLLTEYDVDLVFSGHQHRYERSKLIYNDASTENLNIVGDGGIIEQNDYNSYDGSQKGVVYIVSGGTGNVNTKKSPNNNPYTATRPDGSKIYIKANHYLSIEVDNAHNRLVVKAMGYEVKENETIDFSHPPTSLDQFTLVKQTD